MFFIQKSQQTYMKKHLILNWIFLLGLSILLLNDHVLKAAWHNGFTGKLSDFAGLLIFPLFLKLLLPISNKQAVWATLLGFVFWKSPYAQVVIDGVNILPFVHLVRVVDYTDFVAFLVLPLAYYVLENIERFRLQVNLHKSLAYNVVLGVSVFSFVATSQDVEPLDPSIGNCCSRMPVIADVGMGNIFIPTIFTPDNNGINDFFQVVADSNIARIDTFIVRDVQNGSRVFYAENIIDIVPENGFDGRENGQIQAAQYEYIVHVSSIDDVQKAFSGLICSVPCIDSMNIIKPGNLEACAFATQFSFQDGYHPDNDSGEDLDCFE